jgi:hypothetical protein
MPWYYVKQSKEIKKNTKIKEEVGVSLILHDHNNIKE